MIFFLKQVILFLINLICSCSVKRNPAENQLHAKNEVTPNHPKVDKDDAVVLLFLTQRHLKLQKHNRLSKRNLTELGSLPPELTGLVITSIFYK